MFYEKIYSLTVDREVKIILWATPLKRHKEIFVNFEFLIKDSEENYFHAPIGPDHPKYWKLKNLDSEKAQLLQMEYCGISRKQLYAAMKEFDAFVGTGFNVTYNVKIQERIKSLKGIRLTQLSKVMINAR
ncbi:hypothetical protein [Dyadobacter frigoris]|uniref:Uncharacterized protein n=1 Tax=Dyadobacter frigoris TaxID=2576211 RepID=A0A4U6CVK0_9BACT|nr:hypothetical protein [Dyadobacter frigoris]TKT88790.1 hypothetical protein FDK13_26180 [Dyadobacter frigoris]GLU53987.1 hypothetical protein Dfri01_34480 [Dyadobacter frigoris]